MDDVNWWAVLLGLLVSIAAIVGGVWEMRREQRRDAEEHEEVAFSKMYLYGDGSSGL